MRQYTVHAGTNIIVGYGYLGDSIYLFYYFQHFCFIYIYIHFSGGSVLFILGTAQLFSMYAIMNYEVTHVLELFLQLISLESHFMAVSNHYTDNMSLNLLTVCFQAW